MSQLCAGLLDFRVDISRLRPNNGNLRPLIAPPAYEQVAPHCNANKKQLLLLKGLISKKMKTCNIFYTDLLSHVKGARNFSSPSVSNTEKMLLLKEWFNRLNVLIQGNIDPIIFNGISLEFYGSANPRWNQRIFS